jgi:cytochrome c peroxidase
LIPPFFFVIRSLAPVDFFYEASPDVSAFSSKFDAFLAGKYTFTAEEMAGYKLFRGKANCNSCLLACCGGATKPGYDDR